MSFFEKVELVVSLEGILKENTGKKPERKRVFPRITLYWVINPFNPILFRRGKARERRRRSELGGCKTLGESGTVLFRSDGIHVGAGFFLFVISMCHSKRKEFRYIVQLNGMFRHNNAL